MTARSFKRPSRLTSARHCVPDVPSRRVRLTVKLGPLRIDLEPVEDWQWLPAGDRRPEPRDWTKAEAWPFGLKSQRRPRRRPPDAVMPVEPRPNPTPLIGGAEAPLD